MLVVVTFGTDENEARVRGRPAFRVDAVAFKWGWQFTYPALPGVVDRTVRLIPPVLHVPAGVEVAVRLSTRDTTHALWIPDVRYKRDAWLGVAQTFALTFPPGQHISGRCAQYCGLHHSDMVFTVAWTRGVRGVGRAGAGPEAGTVSLVAPRPPYAPVRGVGGAVVATDHKAVAARTLVTAFGFFIAGGVIALLMRLELATPGTSPTAGRCPRRARRTLR